MITTFTMLKLFYILLLGTIAPSPHSESGNPFVSGFNFMKKGTIPENLKDKVFNRLTVLSFYGKSKSGNSIWVCMCSCGKISNVIGSALKNGRTKSCGCLAAELTRGRNSTHGYTRVGKHAPEYNAWEQMKGRCYKETNNRYYRYGARGIKVCDRWLESFDNFISDMGLKPTKKHSLERIDNDGNYEPDNCKWGTDEEQRRNKSSNVWIECDGERLILQDWINKLGLAKGNFYYYKRHNKLTNEQTIGFCIKNNLK